VISHKAEIFKIASSGYLFKYTPKQLERELYKATFHVGVRRRERSANAGLCD
jgi:hypothetical protein